VRPTPPPVLGGDGKTKAGGAHCVFQPGNPAPRRDSGRGTLRMRAVSSSCLANPASQSSDRTAGLCCNPPWLSALGYMTNIRHDHRQPPLNQARSSKSSKTGAQNSRKTLIDQEKSASSDARVVPTPPRQPPPPPAEVTVTPMVSTGLQ
jgi:hypothetical protein